MNNSRQYSSAVDFIDSNNVWDTITPFIDRYALDAHWATEKTYDYMDSVHNRNSIDNNGFTLKSYVHYDLNYVNAFWDGQRMTYGDGDATRTPLTTVDISAHEVAHGWTDYTSDLIYANESGALNESFSDIFGFLVENYARPTNWNWIIGEDIGGAFRSMSNPNSYGDPDTYGGLNWVDQDCTPSSSNDRCGVHSNSGVQNYWFYLLAQGGLGINDVGDSIKVNGIGINNAADIAFRTNTVYLGPSSNFEEARFYSFRSAVDLFGACSPEVEDVINAWHGVGVGDEYQAGLSAQFLALKDTSFCRLPATVNFKTFSSNIYDFHWDFGDGTSSTSRDPSHTYSIYGNFTVKLVADGGSCGIDSLERTAYISVDSTSDCSSFFRDNTQVNSNCTGTLYDHGGLNGDYSVNRKDTFIINVSSADYIQLYFDTMDIEAGYKGACNHDYIEVLDGGIDAASLGRYCNNNRPDSITSTSNQLTVIFFSDNKNVGQGAQLRWACFQSSQPAQVDFTSYPDTSCDGFAQFYAEVSGGYQQLEWDFGDSSFSTSANPIHRYQQNGVYDVQLKIINSQGVDSVIKQSQVVVNRGNGPAVIGDSICVNDVAKLYANGTPNLLWYLSLTTNNSFHIGDSLILNRLTSTRDFYVESKPTVQHINSVPFQISGNTFYTDTAESIFFDVYEPITIETVILRSSGNSGNRRIDIKDSTGTIIFSKLVYVSGSGSQVQIEARLYPGNNYEMTIGSRDIGLLVNEGGASFPYQFGNLMSIHSSSLGGSAYPFFYFIRIKPIQCTSIRSKVTAFVDTSCVITKIRNNKKTSEGFSVYPIPFTNEVSIKFPTSENKLDVVIFDAQGSLVYEGILSANQQKINLGLLKSKGIYFLKAVGAFGTYHQKLIKQ
jgi:PKD repeat protein